MLTSISHDRADESMEAKARWFQTLSIEERLEFLCELVDMALEVRPQLAEPADATCAEGSLRIVRAA